MAEAPAPTPALQEAVRLHLAGDLGRAEAPYKIDTRDTDSFERNATCAVDSVFVRL